MSGPAQVAIVDTLPGDRAQAAARVAELVDAVNDEWAQAGVAGCGLTRAEAAGGRLVLVTIPGAMPLTVERVRQFLQPKTEKAA